MPPSQNTADRVAYQHKLVFLTVPEAEASEMKMLTDLGSAEGPVTGSQTAFSHCVLTWWEEQGSTEGSSPICGGPILMPSSPPKIPSSNTVALGMRGST